MSKSILQLRTTGFARLRPGRIHLRCPMCGRKSSNARREEYDPPEAALAEIVCDKHDGLKDPGTDYFDAKGKPVLDAAREEGEG